jgi:hypothetical protein
MRKAAFATACLLFAACGENEPAKLPSTISPGAATVTTSAPAEPTAAERAGQFRGTLVFPKGSPGQTWGPSGVTELQTGVRLPVPLDTDMDEQKRERFQVGDDEERLAPPAPAGARDGAGVSGATRSTSRDGIERVSGALAGTTTPAPTFTFTNNLNYQIGGAPADANMAAGISHLCISGRDAVACFTKAGVPVQIDPQGADIVSGEQFFVGLTQKDAMGNSEPVFDMRSYYDIFRNRFVIVGLGGKSSVTFVAVSKTLDPTKGWNKYGLQSTILAACTPTCTNKPGTNPPNFVHSVDYPRVGVDATAMYVSNTGANARDCDGNGVIEDKTNERCLYEWVNLRDAQQMADGVAPASLRSWSFWDLKLPNQSLAMYLTPVVAQTAPSRGYLIGNDGASKLAIFGVNNPLAANQSVSLVEVNVAAFGGAVLGKQGANPSFVTPHDVFGPDLKFDELLNTPLNASSRGNKVLLTFNDAWAVNGVNRAAGRLIRLDMTNFATGSVAVNIDKKFGISNSGDFAGSVFDYGWPGAIENAAGDIAVTSIRTSINIYPQLRMSAWGNGDADLRESILWQASTAALYADAAPAPTMADPNPSPPPAWIDCTAQSIDPTDNSGVYFAQEFANRFGTHNFAIQVGKMFGTTKPDVAPGSLSASKTTIAVGGTVTLTGTATNLGDAPMPASKGQWYLSTDQVILSTDTKLGAAFDIGGIGVGQNWGTISTLATIPSTVTPGTYYIGFCTDTTSLAGEYAEGNNCNNVTSALAPIQVTITSTAPAVRINCGDNGAQSPFLADQFFSGGAGKTRANAIDLTGVSNPAPLAVYQSQHYASPFSYTIPGFTAGSSHLIRLHFAETNPVNNAAGKRKFSVTINGGLQISNLDLFATVGMNKAYIKEFTLNANSSGQYVLSFTASVDSATISGIEIL